jgi:hypothetical protein
LKQVEKHILTTAAIALIPLLAGIGFVLYQTRDDPEGEERSAAAARVSEFLMAVRNGRFDDAWNLVDPAYREASELEGFRQTLLSSEPLRSFDSFQLRKSDPLGDPPRLTGRLFSGQSETSLTAHLARRDAAWFLSDVVVEGRSVLRRPL